MPLQRSPSKMAETISSVLDSIQCCTCCVNRFLGEKDPRFYSRLFDTTSNSNSTTQSEICEDNTDDDVDEVKGICVACLGLFQKENTGKILEKIESSIRNSGYEFEDFTLALFLPPCLLGRQHSIRLFILEKISSFYESDMKENQVIPSVKEVFKWMYGPALENALGVGFKHLGPFKVSLNLSYDDNIRELECLLGEVHNSKRQHGRKRRKVNAADAAPSFTLPVINKALAGLSEANEFRSLSDCPPLPPSTPLKLTEIKCFHASLYLAGRYNKYSRTLPQSPWVIDGVRRAESSVEEKLQQPIAPVVRAQECRFSAAGREDVDVRMLGEGRPFVLEFVDPKVTRLSRESLACMQQQINTLNQDIRVTHLQVVTKEQCATLKDAETTKTKSYSAVVWTKKEITQDDLNVLAEIKDLQLQQKTPIRVLHRRNLSVREKMIHNLEPKWVDSHHFRLSLKTQAGTYVKEFVHGDFGRTKPNLGTLLKTEADILELDVQSVDVDWPPRLPDDGNDAPTH